MENMLKICALLVMSYLAIRLLLSKRGRISLFGISIGWRNE